MKKFYLLFLAFFCVFSLSQEIDPDFYQTWYLTEVYPHDGYPQPIVVEEIEPGITPYLTVSESLDYVGVGACNSFMGTFNFYVEYGTEFINTLNFGATEQDCGDDSHSFLESAFFNTISSELIEMTITEVENGQSLVFYTPPFGWIIFQNFPLSIQEIVYQNSKISIAPNPSSSFIKVQSEEEIISVSIFDTNGRIIQEIKNNFNQINIQKLEKGVYLIKIKTQKADVFKKFIKS